jgi:hypothetical protein
LLADLVVGYFFWAMIIYLPDAVYFHPLGSLPLAFSDYFPLIRSCRDGPSAVDMHIDGYEALGMVPLLVGPLLSRSLRSFLARRTALLSLLLLIGLAY